MGILDTFYILFETDAQKADREMEDLRQTAKETANEVDKSVQNAKELAPAIDQANNETGRLGQAFRDVSGFILASGAAIYTSLLAASAVRMGEIDAVSKFAERLGDNVSEVDAWRKAVKASGGELATAETALESYGQTLAKINAGMNPRAGKALDALGLSSTDTEGNLKTARVGLLELASALEGLERQKQLAKIRALGIVDPATIRLLLSGRAAVEAQTEAQKRNGVVTAAQAKAVKDYKDSADGVKAVLDGWTGAILSMVLPALTALNEALEWGGKWLNDNATFAKAFIGALAAVAAFVLAVYAPAWWAAAAAVIAATWPILLAVAAVAALALAFALAYEDMSAFFNGQKSLIGDLMDRYPAFARVVAGLVRAFKTVWDFVRVWGPRVAGVIGAVIGGIVSFVRGVYAILAPLLGFTRDVLVAGFRAISGAFMDMVRPWLPVLERAFAGMVVAMRALADVFADIFGWIGRAWSRTFGNIARGLNIAVNGARRLLGMGVSENADRAARGIGAGQQQLGVANRSPFAAATPQSVAAGGRRGGDRYLNIGEVRVETQATDAQGMAAGAAGALNGQLRDTATFFDDGVAR